MSELIAILTIYFVYCICESNQPGGLKSHHDFTLLVMKLGEGWNKGSPVKNKASFLFLSLSILCKRAPLWPYLNDISGLCDSWLLLVLFQHNQTLRSLNSLARISDSLPVCWEYPGLSLGRYWPSPLLLSDSAAILSQSALKSQSDGASWTTSSVNSTDSIPRPPQLGCGLQIIFMKLTKRNVKKSAKDIFMWVSCVGRLGYCSTQGLRSVTGWTLSSPNRPWSMASGGMLSGNLPPRTGCPPRHQLPVFTHSGGL